MNQENIIHRCTQTNTDKTNGFFNLKKSALITFVYKCNRMTSAFGTRCPPNAMNIIFWIRWHIIIYYQSNSFHINTSR